MTSAPWPDDLQVLLLPGWLDSGPGHWQTLWESQLGFLRVRQADWQWPRRGDWMARLEETLLEGGRPALLACHSLGCHLAAAWAAHSQHRHQVVGALLVAPPDLARADLPPQLAPWRPPVTARLPWPAVLAYSDDDPFAAPAASLALADVWGAAAWPLGARGHINAESGLGEWPEGQDRLRALLQRPGARQAS